MLSFTSGGVTYSTGVNDTELTNNGVVFTPSNFRAFIPLEIFSARVGQGALEDGSSTSAIAPIYSVTNNDITEYLTDGVNGLGFSTFGNDVGTVTNFFVSNLDPSKLVDDVPDFLYFNNAAPSSAQIEFRLFDIDGNQLGTDAGSPENAHPNIAMVVNDRFNVGANPEQANQNVSVQGFTLSLAEFNLTAAEIPRVFSL